MQLFSTRDIFLDLEISRETTQNRFSVFFGGKNNINDIDRAQNFLKDKMDDIITELKMYLFHTSTLNAIVELEAILYAVNIHYSRDRKQREELKKAGVQNDLLSIFEENRDVALCITNAANIWIENTVLLNIDDTKEKIINLPLNKALLLNLYIYGLVSNNLSLIALSKKFKKCKTYRGFFGISITPDSSIPIEPLFSHPVIYTNTLVTGNQNMLSSDDEYAKANSSLIGLAFKTMYQTEILPFCTALYSIYKNYPDTQLFMLPIAKFKSYLKDSVNVSINADLLFDGFTISQTKLSLALRDGDDLLWKIGVNKFRYELCPFILYMDKYVLISPTASFKSYQSWNSFLLNGGLPYTDCNDEICKAFDLRNTELSTHLISRLKEILSRKYPNHFCEIDVTYDKIWDTSKYPKQVYDYGDYDIIFLDKDKNELFLIEAKFFSDALHASRIVSDYEKLFADNGYYNRCRKRYDLLINDSIPMKAFVGADGQAIKAHTLFISSKQINVEFQDEDKIVTFLSLENFEKYLDGKLLSEEDETVIVRPAIEI